MLILLCLLLATSHGALWREENMREVRTMKRCFEKDYVNLITNLFPTASVERDKRESIFIDSLGREIMSGYRFCDALARTIETHVHYIEHRFKNAPAEEHRRWQQTLDKFRQRGMVSRAECMPRQGEGPLSEMSNCISRTLQTTAKALIKAQYAEEERGFKLK